MMFYTVLLQANPGLKGFFGLPRGIVVVIVSSVLVFLATVLATAVYCYYFRKRMRSEGGSGESAVRGVGKKKVKLRDGE